MTVYWDSSALIWYMSSGLLTGTILRVLGKSRLSTLPTSRPPDGRFPEGVGEILLSAG